MCSNNVYPQPPDSPIQDEASRDPGSPYWAQGMYLDYPGHHGTAGHLDGREPFTVQTIWFLSGFEQENGGTCILPDSSH